MSEPWGYQALCWVPSLHWQTRQTLPSLQLAFSMGDKEMNEQFQCPVGKCFDRGNSGAIGLQGRTKSPDCGSQGRMCKSVSSWKVCVLCICGSLKQGPQRGRDGLVCRGSSICQKTVGTQQVFVDCKWKQRPHLERIQGTESFLMGGQREECWWFQGGTHISTK